MSDLLRSAIRITWTRNGAYAQRLAAGLDSKQVFAAPAPRVMNHPAWILCHLDLYQACILCLLRAQPFDDPMGQPYGRNSSVSMDPSDYLAWPPIVERYSRGHDAALSALHEAPEDLFARPNPLERWRTLHPRIGEQLVTLMVKHESFHLGQFSAWRRASGLPPVEM